MDKPLLTLIIWIITKHIIMNTIKREMPVIHPGKFLLSELIEANGLTISEVAEMLLVSRQTISNIINEKSDISPEMALRIATVFGGTPDIWLRLQTKYDLQIAAKKVKQIKLTPYRPGRTA
jgi:addiction module HigA family antidote